VQMLSQKVRKIEAWENLRANALAIHRK